MHMATLRVFYDKWVVAIAAAEDDNGDGDANLTDEEKMYVLSLTSIIKKLDTVAPFFSALII